MCVRSVASRHANFSDASRRFTGDGMGFVRIYPSSAGSFEAIHAGVKAALGASGTPVIAGAGVPAT